MRADIVFEQIVEHGAGGLQCGGVWQVWLGLMRLIGVLIGCAWSNGCNIACGIKREQFLPQCAAGRQQSADGVVLVVECATAGVVDVDQLTNAVVGVAAGVT